MSGTGFLTAAYDNGMEPLLLLFVLSTLDKNNDLKHTLESFLRFYRENRELITMLAGKDGAGKPPAKEPEPCAEKKESRPPVRENGSMKILEEYLNRSSI